MNKSVVFGVIAVLVLGTSIGAVASLTQSTGSFSASQAERSHIEAASRAEVGLQGEGNTEADGKGVSTGTRTEGRAEAEDSGGEVGGQADEETGAPVDSDGNTPWGGSHIDKEETGENGGNPEGKENREGSDPGHEEDPGDTEEPGEGWDPGEDPSPGENPDSDEPDGDDGTDSEGRGWIFRMVDQVTGVWD